MRNQGFCATEAEAAMDERQLKAEIDPKSCNASDVAGLIRRAFAYMDTRIDPPSSLHRMSISDFESKMREERLVVIRREHQMLACMFCRPENHWLYVGKVAVEPTLQGQGLGTALFQTAFELATNLGLKGLELETRIELSENHRAFEKLGFKKISLSAHPGYTRPTSIKMRAALQDNA